MGVNDAAISRYQNSIQIALSFYLTGVFPIVVAGFFFGSWKKPLIEEYFHKWTAIQDIRKGQIENHFPSSFADRTAGTA